MKLLTFSGSGAKFDIYSPEETEILGEALGREAYPGLCIMLFGSLGAGKTLLTQGIGKALGVTRVKSPTFIIVNEHEGTLPLVHADLYRLERDFDVESLDLGAYLDEGCLVVIEWGERWQSPPGQDRLDILIDRCRDEAEHRRITIEPYGERAYNMLERSVKRSGSTGC